MECLVCREMKRENLIRLTSSNILGFLDPLVSLCDLLSIDPNYFHQLKLTYYCNTCHADFYEVMRDLREFKRLENKLSEDRIRIEGKLKNSIKRTRKKADDDFNQNLRKKIINELSPIGSNGHSTSFQSSQSSGISEVSSMPLESSSDALYLMSSFDISRTTEALSQVSDVSQGAEDERMSETEKTETKMDEIQLLSQTMKDVDELKMDHFEENAPQDNTLTTNESYREEDKQNSLFSSEESNISEQHAQENGPTMKEAVGKIPTNKFHPRSRSITPTRLIPFLPLLPIQQVDKDVEFTMSELLNGVVKKSEMENEQSDNKISFEVKRRLSVEKLKMLENPPTLQLTRLCQEAIEKATKKKKPARTLEVDLTDSQICKLCYKKIVTKLRTLEDPSCSLCIKQVRNQKSFEEILEKKFFEDLNGLKKYVCFCKLSFQSLTEFRGHLRLKHSKKRNVHWSCLVCSMKFISVAKLRHRKKLSCPHCPVESKFDRLVELRKHVVNDHIKMKRICNFCVS